MLAITIRSKQSMKRRLSNEEIVTLEAKWLPLLVSLLMASCVGNAGIREVTRPQGSRGVCRDAALDALVKRKRDSDDCCGDE